MDLPSGLWQTSALSRFLSSALTFKSWNYSDKLCLFEGVKVLLVLLRPEPLNACQLVFMARFIYSVRLAHSLVVFVLF